MAGPYRVAGAKLTIGHELGACLDARDMHITRRVIVKPGEIFRGQD